jgi:hypothetical protein
MMKIFVVLHLKYPLFLSDFNETLISRQIFEKYSHFDENPSSGSGVVSCGLTEGRTYITRLIDAFRKIAKSAYKYEQSFIYSPTDPLVSCLKNNIKIYIKTAPTCFGAVTPPSGSALIRA